MSTKINNHYNLTPFYTRFDTITLLPKIGYKKEQYKIWNLKYEIFLQRSQTVQHISWVLYAINAVENWNMQDIKKTQKYALLLMIKGVLKYSKWSENVCCILELLIVLPLEYLNFYLETHLPLYLNTNILVYSKLISWQRSPQSM